MKKISKILLSTFAATCLLFASCSDEIINLSNDLGSSLKEQNNIKVSSFFIDKKYWDIPDTTTNLIIRLTSHTDNTVREYPASVSKNDNMITCSIQIPKNDRIPDSDYDLNGTYLDGKPLGNMLKATFHDEMFHFLIGAAMEYCLYGNGTEEKPYKIETADDFNQFEYDLSRDSINHGAGLYFIQTGDFEAPKRSDAYQGRYYEGYKFSGIYDGGNHSITLPYIGSMTDDDMSIGLFKELGNGAFIKNLTIKPRMSGIKKHGGAVAGISRESVKISNVTVEGNITNSGSHIAGFVGYATGKLTIENCRLFADISGTQYIGGAVGGMTDCEFHVDGFSNLKEDFTTSLFTINSEHSNTGGVAGSIYKGSCDLKNITLQHSISEEDVNLKVIYSGGDNCGAVIGEAKLYGTSSIQDVKILTPVRAEGNSIGGLIGYCELKNDLTISNCKSASLVKGNSNVGGFFGMIRSDNHLILDGHDNTNRIAPVDNGYNAVEGKTYVGGMFGILENDIQAKSVCVINVNVTASSNFAGGVAGKNHNNTLKCKYFSLDPDMQVTGPDAVGGIVGYSDYCTIIGRIEKEINFSSIPSPDSFKSDFGGTVSSGSNDPGNGTSMGGIIGYAKNCHISNLTCTGKVYGKERVGGIVGHLHNEDRGDVKNCVSNTTAIKNTKGDMTGGVIGKVETYTGTYNHFLNYGNVEGLNFTGGVFGWVEGFGPYDSLHHNIDYAVNLGDVSGTKTVGGCFAVIDNTYGHFTVKKSANYGKISNSGEGYIGGIVGLGNSTYLSVMNCANHGEIAAGSGKSEVGGIAGKLGVDATFVSQSNNMRMGYCCNRGKVSSGNKHSHIGGLLGYQEEGMDNDDVNYMTHDCYNTGEVTSNQDKDNGGIVGFVDHFAEVVRCINIGKVHHGNGVVGTHKDAGVWYHHNLYYLEGTGKGWCATSFKESKKKEKATFNDFDFDKVWAIDENDKMNNGFPYLRDCPFQSIYK